VKPDFEELVARYDKRLVNVMYGLTGDYDDALDLAEEAFVSAMRAYDGFRGDADPFTWLYRIAVNVFKKRHRRQARRAALWRDHAEQDPPPSAEWRTPALDAVERERAAAVRAAVAGLREPYREAIVLRYMSDASYEEIAAVTRCSAGTVKSRIARGKAMLGRLLEGKV